MVFMFEMLNIKCANNIVTFTCITYILEGYSQFDAHLKAFCHG